MKTSAWEVLAHAMLGEHVLHACMPSGAWSPAIKTDFISAHHFCFWEVGKHHKGQQNKYECQQATVTAFREQAESVVGRKTARAQQHMSRTPCQALYAHSIVFLQQIMPAQTALLHVNAQAVAATKQINRYISVMLG